MQRRPVVSAELLCLDGRNHTFALLYRTYPNSAWSGLSLQGSDFSPILSFTSAASYFTIKAFAGPRQIMRWLWPNGTFFDHPARPGGGQVLEYEELSLAPEGKSALAQSRSGGLIEKPRAPKLFWFKKLGGKLFDIIICFMSV